MLMVAEDDLTIHTFNRFEYLFDAVISKYYWSYEKDLIQQVL